MMFDQNEETAIEVPDNLDIIRPDEEKFAIVEPTMIEHEALLGELEFQELPVKIEPESVKKEFSSVNSRKRLYICSRCGKNFTTTFNLRRHMVSCKLCPPDERGPRFPCSCGRTYSQEFDLKKHQRKCKNSSSQCKKCLLPDCKLLFYHRAQLLAHMKSSHNLDVPEPEELHFETFEDFMKWKELVEEKTFTYYSKQTGANVTGVSVNSYYICQHDGSGRAHNPNGRKTDRRNKKGRVKVGRFCWAQMNVKEFKDGTVKVTFYQTHTHPVDISNLEHHPLPNSISLEILRRLEQLKKNEDLDGVSRGRKKSFHGNLRMMRSLARKNRKMFRMTTEQTQTETDDNLGDLIIVANKVEEDKRRLERGTEDVEQQEQSEEDTRQLSAVEECRARCIILASQLSSFLAADSMPGEILNEIEEKLQGIMEQCQRNFMAPESPKAIVGGPIEDSSVAAAEMRVPDEKVGVIAMEQGTVEPDNNPGDFITKPLLAEDAVAVLQNPLQIVQSPEFIILAWDNPNLFQTLPATGS